MDPSFDDIRAEVAALLGEPAEDIDPDALLMDLGLDSLRLMTLFSCWEAQGAAVDHARFMELPTLNGLWQAIREARE